MSRAAEIKREKHPVEKIAKILGSGFITGAADDDPSGIGTYSLAGASLGRQTIGPVLTALGWIVTIAMFAALAGLAITSFAP